MYVARNTSLLVLCFILLSVFTVSIAFAQDATEVGASAQTEVGAPPPPQGKPRPLQILHEKRVEAKQEAKTQWEDLKEQKMDVRADMKANLKTATSGPMRKDVLQKGKAQLEELRGQQKDAIGSMKERLQNLFRTHLGAAISRLNNATDRFDGFIARIESRIVKMQERGIDTSSAEASLEAAEGLVTIAKDNVSALSSLVSSVNDTDDPEAVRAEIRATLKTAMESVKAAHRALIAVVKELGTTAPSSSPTINNEASIDASEEEVE